MSTAPRPWFSKRVLIFIGLGLLILVLYLYYFVGASNIADVIRQTDLLYYATAFIAFVTGVFFASLTWHSLLSNLAIEVKIRRALLLTWVGMFFDSTVPEPGWSGDLSKAYILARTCGQDMGRIVASVVSQKIIGMIVTIIDLILGLVILARNYVLSGVLLAFIGIVLFLSIFSLAIVWYLSAKPRATARILDWLIRVISFFSRRRWHPADFRHRGEELLSKFHEGFSALGAKPKALVKPFLFSLMGWGFDVSVVFLTFASLGYPVTVDKVLIVYALTGSLQMMGVSFVGFTEIVMSGAYTVLGIPAAMSLSATLLTRVVTLWFKLIVSYVAFQWAGIEILTNKKSTNIARTN